MKNFANERPVKKRDKGSENPGNNMNAYPASLWDQEKAGGMLALLSQLAVENDGEQQLPFRRHRPYNRRGNAKDKQKREEE